MNVHPRKCAECKKRFSNIFNLRKHVTKFHSDKTEYLASLHLRRCENYNYACDKCHKRFMQLKDFRYHVNTQHGDGSLNVTKPKTHQCALCDDFRAIKRTVLEHYSQFHNISIEQRILTFQTEEDFLTWKLAFEDDSNSKYIIECRKTFKTYVLKSYICHRSGEYVPAGHNLRNLKKLGSKKINALCPASIKMKKFKNGSCEVSVIENHVGHDNDVAYLNLSKLEREYIAEKIASNVPFDDILNEIRSSRNDSELKRLHLLTRKDLHNIVSRSKMCSSLEKHENDETTVEMQMENPNVGSCYYIIVDQKLPNTVETVYLPEVVPEPTTTSLADRKERVVSLLKKLQDDVHGMTSNEELDVVEEAVVPIEQRLAALSQTVEPNINENDPVSDHNNPVKVIHDHCYV